MAGKTAKEIILGITAGGLYFFVWIALFGAIILINGPVSLSPFRSQIEYNLTKARQGKPVTITDLTLQWSPTERRLLLIAHDLSFKEAETGDESGHFAYAALTVHADSLLFGKLEISKLFVRDGWIDIHSKQARQWSIAGSPVPVPEVGQLPQTLAGWASHIDTVLDDQLAIARDFTRTTTLQHINFENVDIRVLSTNGALLAGIGAANGDLENTGRDLNLTLAGNGTHGPVPDIFSAALVTNDGGARIEGNLDTGAVPLAMLAQGIGLTGPQSGLFSVGASFALKASRDEGLQEISMVVTGQDGQLPVPLLNETITDIDTALTYRPAGNTLTIDRFNLKAHGFETAMSGRLEYSPGDSQALRFKLDADTIRFDRTDNSLANAWTITEVEALITLAETFRQIVVERLVARVDDSRMEASGQISLPEKPQGANQLPFFFDAEAVFTGAASKDNILQYWPLNVSRQARDYVAKRLERGTVTEGRIRIALGPDSLRNGVLRDKDLDVTFDFEESRLRFLDDFPALAEARGIGRFTGNSFTMIVHKARYGDWDIDSGQIDFPQLVTPKPYFTIKATGSGPTESILDQITDSRMGLQEYTNFDFKRIGGQAQGTLTMTHPLSGNVQFGDLPLFGKTQFDGLSFSVRGKVNDGYMRAVIGNLDVTGARVDVDLTQNNLRLAGSGMFAGAPAQFEWYNSFDEKTAPANLSVQGLVTADMLNAFGLASRAFLDGNVPLILDSTIVNDRVEEARMAFDLNNAALNFARIGWRKPAGDALQVQAHYVTGPDNQRAITVQAQSDNNNLDSVFNLAENGEIESVSLRRLVLADIADIAANIYRTDGNGLVVNVSGPFLNIVPLLPDFDMSDIFDMTAQSDRGPLAVDVRIERTVLKKGRALVDMDFRFRQTENGLESIVLNSRSDDGTRLEAFLQSSGPGMPAIISFTSGDAGFVTEAFFGNQSMIRGGQVVLSGVLSDDDQLARLLLRITNIRVKNAPILTQILSLTSFRGLADMLAGEGILFSQLEMPITIDKSGYKINDGRANGPALGLTMNGHIGTGRDRTLDVNGVLVPSFFLNSFLGRIPIIGTIGIGRQGEGVFSIQYTVTGTLTAAKVVVNPLSVVTPGILRRIFEPAPPEEPPPAKNPNTD